MRRHPACIVCTLGLAALFLYPAPAQAYIGPGAGLSAVGAFLAVLAAVVVAVFGFIWYPVKRLIRKLRAGRRNTKEKGPT